MKTEKEITEELEKHKERARKIDISKKDKEIHNIIINALEWVLDKKNKKIY